MTLPNTNDPWDWLAGDPDELLAELARELRDRRRKLSEFPRRTVEHLLFEEGDSPAQVARELIWRSR
jgi:hypothetical protein